MLHVDVNADSNLAKACQAALRGVQPIGAPLIMRFKYSWLLLLAAAAAVADGTDAALRGLCPARGTFELAWMQALFRALDAAGLFGKAPSGIEELILKVQSHLRDLTARLPDRQREQLLTHTDYNQAFTPLAAALTTCNVISVLSAIEP